MGKKKSARKVVSKRAAKGRASVKKGVKFQEMVADLYRLLGAQVTENIEICHKKVDIFARFPLPGSTAGHRVIVECKDEKKPSGQNARVREFDSLLRDARRAGEADSAAIITGVSWSDQAKGVARSTGVELLTYQDKIAQLIDLRPYLKDLVERFEKGDPNRPNEPPLGSYYVDLSAERRTEKGVKKLSAIDAYVHEWLQEEDTRQLAVLGGYGTGKTCLGQKLAHDLAKGYLKAPGASRIPVLFNLREFTKALKIESLVTSFLDEECRTINPRFKLFRAMNEAGIFLLIFDGFDEMAVRVDADTLEINLQEIDKVAAASKAKVIVTSRIEYFITAEEEKRALYPRGELLAARQVQYEPLRICPWDDAQVNSFLRKRVPLMKGNKHFWTYYRNRIRRIPGLADLSRRPVLLEMIVRTLPHLVATSKVISRPNLYHTYLMGEIKRQKILKKRKLLLSEEVRFLLLQQLALDFYGGEIAEIGFSDAEKYVEGVVKPPKSEVEAYTREFLTCSFLIREGDTFRFSHRSIMEYLAATALLEEIKKDDPHAFRFQKLDRVVAAFLAELQPPKNTIWRWLESTRGIGGDSARYLGGNAATMLCRLDPSSLRGKDLSGTNLTGANLAQADLRNTGFSGGMLRNVNLCHAKLLNNDLHSAKIEHIRVSLLYLVNLSGQKTTEGGRDRTHSSVQLRHSFVDKLRARILAVGGAPYRIVWDLYDENYLFLACSLDVPDLRRLLVLLADLDFESLTVSGPALHWDQCERLLDSAPPRLTKDLGAFLERVRHFV